MDASPNRYLRHDNEEGGEGAIDRDDEIISSNDAFDIPPKNASVDRLRRWRQAALVLNASRRFRYTLDLKKGEEKEKIRRKIRAHAQVIRAAFLFKEAGEREGPCASNLHGTSKGISVLPSSGYGIGVDQLASITRDHDYAAFQRLGGVRGLSNMLKTNIDGGISGNDAEVLDRRNVFGSNSYPRKKGRSFYIFLWEACQDTTLVILMIAAVVSLVLGMTTEARAGIDYESSFGKARPNDTILKLQRTTPYYKRNRAHVCSFYVRGECTRGAECPYRHEMPITGELSQQNIKDRYYGVNDPVALKLLSKAGEMSSIAPPDDESIKTLYVGGLDARVNEEDLRDHFYAHGEIESIRMVLQRACAFVTYTTREGAERAAEELSNKLVVKGLRLKLMWGRPQAPKPEAEGGADDEAARQGLVAHGGMLPRAVVSQQQQGTQQPQPPGTQDQQMPLHYFNIPPPMPQDRTFYPSMDPQRMGALVPSQDANDGKSGLEKQGQQRSSDGSGHGYMAPPPLQGQYPQYYPPYGYMARPYQQPYPPYQPMMAPPPPPSAAAVQQYQPSGPSGSGGQT